jgi:hypothetical protein
MRLHPLRRLPIPQCRMISHTKVRFAILYHSMWQCIAVSSPRPEANLVHMVRPILVIPEIPRLDVIALIQAIE